MTAARLADAPLPGARLAGPWKRSIRKADLLPWTGPISLVLHGLLVAMLLVRFVPRGPQPVPPPPSQATLQVEYVNQFAQQKGAPATAAAKPAAAAQPAEPAPTPTPASAPAQEADPPLPRMPDGELPVPKRPAPPAKAAAAPPPSPAAPPATAQPSPASQQPTVNLGNSDEDRDPLLVTGDHVVSSGPDARYRNMPPDYPREAAQRHQQGTVELLVHVTPDGQAGEIDTVASSGADSLDNAARNAVARWHFVPAVQNGVKIASVFPIRINFREDGW